MGFRGTSGLLWWRQKERYFLEFSLVGGRKSRIKCLFKRQEDWAETDPLEGVCPRPLSWSLPHCPALPVTAGSGFFSLKYIPFLLFYKVRGVALRKKKVPDYKCILLGFLFLSFQTKAFLLPSLIDLPTLLMWVDGSACSESFASFSSVTFPLFQLPFLYNYWGCSSEQECCGADSRAGCPCKLHPYPARALGTVDI